jgi:hypothetical protein
MARRKAKTMEVIEEALPEEQSESEAMKPPEPADPPASPPDPQRQAEQDRAAEAAAEAMDILAKIEDATRNVDDAAREVASAKQELKYRKEVYESHVERLKELCRTRMEDRPLFHAGAEQAGADGEDADDADQATDKDGWKELPLEKLGLPAAIAKALDEDGFGTIGMLADEMAADPLSWHEDIKGVGPAAVATIAETFAAFWREHPEWDDDGDDGVIEDDEEEEEDEEDDEDTDEDDE